MFISLLKGQIAIPAQTQFDVMHEFEPIRSAVKITGLHVCAKTAPGGRLAAYADDLIEQQRNSQ